MVNEFFLPMIIPTVTQQEHKVMVRSGKPVIYDPPELKEARKKYTAALWPHRPVEMMTGPIRLTTKWIWPSEDPGQQVIPGATGYSWKTTKPDTDNLIKAFKDCMTRCGFWRDDAQVASEITEKFYGTYPGIYVRVEELT